MVKFNKILAVVCASTLSAVLAASATDEYGKDCKDIKEFISQYNMTADRCGTSADNNVEYITIQGDSINQKVIDKIGSYSSIKEVTFRGIKNIPKNLNLESLHINNLDFTDKVTIDYPEYPVLTIPKGVLKTAKNVRDINIALHKISKNNISEINTLTKLVNLRYDGCTFEKGIDYSKLKNLKNLKSLVLYDVSYVSGNGTPFDEISKYICQLKKLESLNVEGSSVKTIPKCIGNLTNLQKLILQSNEIKTLPEEISKLTKLTELDLTGNKISTVPSAIGNLSNLQRLSLTGNNISKIPTTITKLTNLKDLYMANNKIKSIPKSITKLQKLESLSLNFNSITDIPEFLAKLKNIESIDLSNNKIDDEIPESLNVLAKLSTFKLDNNVDIRGETLSNAKLLTCSYNVKNNKSDDLCQDANNRCIVEGIPYC